MSQALQTAADEIRNRLIALVEEIKAEPKMAEALKLQEALNTIERLMGADPTPLSEVFGLDAALGRPKFKVGEFFRVDQLDAAKRYLDKVGEARPLSEIVSVIREFGGKVTSEDDLRISLSRSTFDIAKVGTDLYGLLKYFPDAQRSRGKKKPDAGRQTPDAAAANGNADEEPPPATEEPAEANSPEGGES
jgi:hypothetical protein